MKFLSLFLSGSVWKYCSRGLFEAQMLTRQNNLIKKFFGTDTLKFRDSKLNRISDLTVKVKVGFFSENFCQKDWNRMLIEFLSASISNDCLGERFCGPALYTPENNFLVVAIFRRVSFPQISNRASWFDFCALLWLNLVTFKIHF